MYHFSREKVRIVCSSSDSAACTAYYVSEYMPPPPHFIISYFCIQQCANFFIQRNVQLRLINIIITYGARMEAYGVILFKYKVFKYYIYLSTARVKSFIYNYSFTVNILIFSSNSALDPDKSNAIIYLKLHSIFHN